MASPPYPTSGPSSYYVPPHPHQYYGNGPAPVPYYPQQYHLPPMNGHVPMHPPTSPRMNPPNRGRFNGHRGVSSYHYHHMTAPHGMHPGAAMQSPPVSPVSSYTQPQKYSPHMQHMPYSPPIPHQPNGSYPPAWAPQQLSPLPKQLSMPPPAIPSHSAQTHPQPQLPPPHLPQSVLVPQSPQQLESAQADPSMLPLSEPLQEPPSSSSPARQPEEAVLAEKPPSHPLSPEPELGQDQAEEAPIESSEEVVQKPSSSMTQSHEYVVWSRRPTDPTNAPGLIIATGAFPPEDFVHRALDLPTPPASPKAPKAELKVEFVQEPTEISADLLSHDSATVSPETAQPLSSSTTETTTASTTPGDTPVPGSPASSRTSVSIAADSSAVTANGGILAPPEEKAETTPTIPALGEAESVSAAEASAVASADATQPATPVAPTPTPKPAVQKKSWASLLQSNDASASSSKSRLPTSSVVGFSIPATAGSGSSALGNAGTATSPHRNELLTLLSQGPYSPASALKIQPRGLVNTGNMCFANAVLQVLVYCPPFNRLFTELGKYLSGPVVGSQKEGTKATPLTDAIVQFMKEFVPEPAADSKAKGKGREDDFYEPESFIPSYVYDAMKEKKRFASMIGGHQEDAEEFLGFFLDTLEEELLLLSQSLSPKATPTANENAEGGQGASSQDEGWYEVGKKNRSAVTRTIKSSESPITRIFGGKFRSTLRAPHQKDSVTIEDWRSLRLDIQREQVHSINDALPPISQPQPVQISQPTRPGVVVEANQQDLIEALPPILILHLKRFHYDTKVGDVVKIGKQIAYGPELEIGPDLMAPTKRTPYPAKYQLFGVLYHHGQSASGGHYTIDVLHPNRDLNDKPRAAWIRIDDELVSDIRPDDVFNTTERDDRCAYLLFYRRVSSGRPPTRT
ncbi:cysteine proteinase [Wolfiporia cocos MD-104 SS10]|uniref:Ubiquitin carboxyl-terminal hydrolase n=1 Tax=Wolfiporia cocos (strain MD-104) TaxID=742152 RepID=A0A2H3J6C4_WOLCO|nr:cysteine proteinase [Wolfiporia cocos MD-104 SS10]